MSRTEIGNFITWSKTHTWIAITREGEGENEACANQWKVGTSKMGRRFATIIVAEVQPSTHHRAEKKCETLKQNRKATAKTQTLLKTKNLKLENKPYQIQNPTWNQTKGNVFISLYYFWINFVYKNNTLKKMVQNSKQDRRLLDALGTHEVWTNKKEKTIFVSGKPRENCNQQHFCCETWRQYGKRSSFV